MGMVNGVIGALWLLLIIYWIVSAIGAKRSIRSVGAWQREALLRLGIFILILSALRFPGVRQALQHMQRYPVHPNLLLGIIGMLICACGIWLAIWARRDLGRNWGMPMARKEQPELVMTGPYAFIRHPIYGGMLLAMAGSAIAVSIIWVVPLVLGGGYFLYCARREERLMMAQFPEQYPRYIQRTKMLLPFLL